MASIDRLSALPDDILFHILSLLPFKTSVSTSALAARWRFLWSSAPNIQLTEDESNSIPESISDHGKFVDVLTKILSQCKAHNVNTLRLHMDYCYWHEFEPCLESAFVCRVKILDLTMRYDPEILPPCVFTSKTLVDLRLNLFDIKIKNVTVCLPALKRLHIEFVSIDGSLENLISGCPVLEVFTVDYFIRCDENVVSHCISSSTMKRLVLNCEFPYKLKIDTPALNYLFLHYNMPHNLSVGSMDSLIEAHIVVDRLKLIVNDDLYSHSLVEFVGRFSSVKEMSLCAWGEVPDLTSVDLNIKFHNLAKLTVEGDLHFISYFVEMANKLEVLNVRQCSECESEPLEFPNCLPANLIVELHNLTKLELQVDCFFLTYFLENADKLKVLILRKPFNRERWLAIPLQVPKCLSSHLKIVQIHELYCTEHELDMVRYLLKNAKVLERMELHCLPESIGRISSFDRGSEICEISFNEYKPNYNRLSFNMT